MLYKHYHEMRLTASHLLFSDVDRLRPLYGKHIETVLDIGANIGLFTLISRVLFPGARAIAVEPGHESFGFLSYNMVGFNVECKKVALGDGTPVNVSPIEDSGILGLCEARAGGDTPSISLSRMFTEWNIKPDTALVKIDVEGSEDALLSDPGAKDILSKVAHWRLELHPTRLRKICYDTWKEWLVSIKFEKPTVISMMKIDDANIVMYGDKND